MKPLKNFILEANEWKNHPKAEFILIDACKGSLRYLTKEELLKEWDIVGDELKEMGSLYKTENSVMLKCLHDGDYIVIKR